LSIPSLKLPIAAIDLVPHRNRMLLIDHLDEFGKDTGRAYLQISDNNLFIKKNSTLDSIVYTELLAQLIAAHSGYESKLNKSDPKMGFLVGIKDFNIHKTVSVGDMIDMHIKKDYEFDQINFVTGEILLDKKVIAEGTLKLWEQPGNNKDFGSPKEENLPNRKFQLSDNPGKIIIDSMVLNKAILTNLYDLVISKDYTSVDGQLYFSDDFIGFDGHFPGKPLLPGIVMMKTGVLISEIVLGKHLQVEKIKHAKFAKSIFPKQKVNLNVKFKNQDNTIQINIILTQNEETCAKYTILVKTE
jgi:3-hydroxyacyl-[acyl-carrier-protein] dehydratase